MDNPLMVAALSAATTSNIIAGYAATKSEYDKVQSPYSEKVSQEEKTIENNIDDEIAGSLSNIKSTVPEHMSNITPDCVVGRTSTDENYFILSIVLSGDDALYDTDADPGVCFEGCKKDSIWQIEGISLKRNNSKITIKINKNYPYFNIYEMCNASEGYADGVDNHIVLTNEELGIVNKIECKTDAFLFKLEGDINMHVRYDDPTGYDPTFIYSFV